MNNHQFFADITAFDDFTGVVDPANYHQAPEDWYVIIADVRESTRAIAEGRYKDVNMIGAACINAVLNISRKRRIPYVFGGDGATLMVPADDVQSAAGVLLRVRRLATQRFDLDLRVGVVSVAQIHAAGTARVRVARYRLSPGNEMATFSGGGMELAERWVKKGSEYLLEDNEDDNAPDLSGLSCRWEPLASQNGVMLSLLMQARTGSDDENADLYRELIRDISQLTEATAEGNPVCDDNLVLRWPPRGLQAEVDATTGDGNRLLCKIAVYANTLLQWLLDRFDITAGGYRGKRYRSELQDNTDYRRFDDTLRILIDCGEEQAQSIEKMLEARARDGVLRYGLHRSDSALMTCLVFNLENHEHVHFVDGSNGGFTAAAKHMKGRDAT